MEVEEKEWLRNFIRIKSNCPLWRSVYSGPLPIFKNWIAWCFGVEFYKFFINFGY